MKLFPVCLKKKQKVQQQQCMKWLNLDDTLVFCSPIPLSSLHFLLLTWSHRSFQLAVPLKKNFCYRCFPIFMALDFSTLIAADSVLTMACELVKKNVWLWELHKIGFESIYLARRLWTTFPSPPHASDSSWSNGYNSFLVESSSPSM